MRINTILFIERTFRGIINSKQMLIIDNKFDNIPLIKHLIPSIRNEFIESKHKSNLIYI